jgi:hypothetical protein
LPPWTDAVASPSPPGGLTARYLSDRIWATKYGAPNIDLTIDAFMPHPADFQVFRMRSLS